MKVVTIANVAPKKMGSFEKFLRDHSYYLSTSGFSHTIIVPQKPIPKVTAALESVGAKVIIFEKLYDNNLLTCWRLYKEVLKEQPTVIHAHFLHIVGSLSFYMLFNKIKFFATYHISGPCASNTLPKTIYKKIRWLILGSSYNRIFCVSNYTRNKFINDYKAPKDRVSVVYNAVNQSEFEHYRQILRTQGCSNQTVLKLITVAALIPEKGVQHLIHACARLSALQFNYQLDIIGEGPYQKQLEKLAIKLGVNKEINFLGTRDDVPELLVTGDIMIVPSIWEEAFGFTILEAMSVGVPLVVSKVGGIPELVEHNVNGLVVEKSSSEQIAQAIITMADSPALRRRFSANGVSKSINNFSIDTQCKTLISFYKY